MEHSQSPAAPRRFAELSGPYWMAGESLAYRLGADGGFEPGRGPVPGRPGTRSLWFVALLLGRVVLVDE